MQTGVERPSSQTTLQLLEERKATLVRQLMRVAPELTRELLMTMDSLFALRGKHLTVISGEYAGYRQPIDAVVAHLRKVGSSMILRDIVEAVIQGGFGPLDDKRETNIRAAIRYAALRSGRLVQVAPRTFGLPEWYDTPTVPPHPESLSS